jgi:3-hydroxyisobutyrate dehydrogenase-like beta-hydroxyacid dehydrogenase
VSADGPRVALIGYGEVGQTLAADLHAAGVRDISAWDCLFPLPASAPRRAARDCGHVQAASSMVDALIERTVIICAVTAANCIPAAREAAASMPPGTYYFDLNSVAPATKRAAAAAVEAAGGRYVEAAVMSPIGPKRIASPMLIGGPHGRVFEPLARAMGFTGLQVFDARLGRAAAAKMCRSVMIKGLEALLMEGLLAARHHGVETAVLESLHDLLPAADWQRIANYMVSRSQQHGGRRAEEMREAALAVSEAGLEPLMSLACAARQDWAAAHQTGREPIGLTERLDAVLASIDAESRAQNRGRSQARKQESA